MFTTGSNVFIAILGVVTGILLARVLGVKGRGELAAIQIWPLFIATIAPLGLPQALMYFCAQERRSAGRYLCLASICVLSLSFVFMVAGYFALPLLLADQQPDIISGARWFMLVLPPYLLSGLPYWVFRAQRNLNIWNILRLLPSLGWLILVLLAIGLGRPNPRFLASGYVALMTVLCVPSFYVVVRHVPGPFIPNFGHLGKMVRFGVPTVLGAFPSQLNFRLDQMLMIAFLPVNTLGLYVVAVSWSSSVNLLLSSLGVTIFPRVASYTDPKLRALALSQGTRLSVIAAVVSAAPLLVVTPWLLPLMFGTKYVASIPAALLLVVAGGVAAVNMVFEEGLRALGCPAAVLWAQLIGLGVTIVGLAVLLIPLQSVGAAIASILAYSLTTVSLAFQARRITGCSSSELLCPRLSEMRLLWDRIRPFGVRMRARLARTWP